MKAFKFATVVMAIASMLLTMAPASAYVTNHYPNSYSSYNKYKPKYGKHSSWKPKYKLPKHSKYSKYSKYPKHKFSKYKFPKYKYPKYAHVYKKYGKFYCKPKGPKPAGHHHHGGAGNTVVWSVIACAGTTITAAMLANYSQNRELTAEEAQSCGILYFFTGSSH